MSLLSEIQALRAEIDAHARRAPAAAPTPAPGEASGENAHDRLDVETFLKTVNETLDEFADELDKYPRLTALAALGVGLAAGVVIGRQFR